MKKVLAGLCCILMMLLPGCTEERNKNPETLRPLPDVYSEEDILNLFMGYAYADTDNRVVLDCAVMEESLCGVIGVVQYTTDDYGGCWFDFLTEGVPMTAGVDAAAGEIGSLECIGMDTVRCQMRSFSREEFVCEIKAYQNAGETGFSVTTKE